MWLSDRVVSGDLVSADSPSLPWQQLLGVSLPIFSLLSLSMSLWRAGRGHQQKCQSESSASQSSNRGPDAVAGLWLLHPHLSAGVVPAARENLSWVEATMCGLSFKSQCPGLERWLSG